MNEITIIVATYNAGATVARCLKSIISQKTDEIELYVIDGASTDDTISIVKSFGDGVDYFISEKDKGVYDAWNKGIKHAKGNWIMFIGADDVLLPNTVSKYLSFISEQDTKDVDIITAKSWIVDTVGNRLGTVGNPYRWQEFRYVMKISHGSTLHKKSFLEEMKGFDTTFKICGDYELLSRRPLNALFFDEYIIAMQDGGLSVSYRGLAEAFRAKRMHKHNPLIWDLYRYLRGGIGMFLWKNFRFKWNFKKQ